MLGCLIGIWRGKSKTWNHLCLIKILCWTIFATIPCPTIITILSLDCRVFRGAGQRRQLPQDQGAFQARPSFFFLWLSFLVISCKSFDQLWRGNKSVALHDMKTSSHPVLKIYGALVTQQSFGLLADKRYDHIIIPYCEIQRQASHRQILTNLLSAKSTSNNFSAGVCTVADWDIIVV